MSSKGLGDLPITKVLARHWGPWGGGLPIGGGRLGMAWLMGGH